MEKKGFEELVASAVQFKILFNQPCYQFAEFSLLCLFNN